MALPKLPPVRLNGTRTWAEEGLGYECDWCGETIGIGDKAVSIDYVEIFEEQGNPRSGGEGFGAIICRSCLR